MENFDHVVTDGALRLAEIETYLRQGTGQELFRGRYVVLATSGSTGRRGVFLFNEAEWIHALAFIARPMAWAGLTTGLRRPPRSALIASTTPWHYSARVSHSLSSRLLPALRLDAAEPLEKMVRRLNGDGLCDFVTGLRDPAWRDELPRTLAGLLERQGALAPPARVFPVENLQRGDTGKAPLIARRQEVRG